nr:hypothetical protein [Pantoea cypripedii]
MDARKLLEGIITDIEAVKQSNATAIEIENLLTYLRGINTDSFNEKPDFELEGMKHNNQSAIEMFKVNNAIQLEAFKSTIAVGANACRAFMVMNGGAAIALLAFLGNIWNKSSNPDASKAIALSLVVFCLGVLASGVCAGMTYFAQFSFGSSQLGQIKPWLWAGRITNALAILSGIASLIAFGYGANSAFIAMGAQLIK